jgi:2,4-dienoyl-CoA reductase-like NADH-dependent reductase (Old Yellow Enzyme family)
MSSLFTPLTLRGVTLRNRIVVSPMCQYSSTDGFLEDWHLVHLGSRAVGGAALVIVEASAVEPRGRISPEDAGIWDDRHVAPLERIARFVRSQGAAFGLQLAHAGRKAGTWRPWEGSGPLPKEKSWEPVGPSAIPWDTTWAVPHALTKDEILAIVAKFQDAARRAEAAGLDLVEIHGAHGYLIHSFLSPLSNRREDEWGGDLAGRARFLLAVVDAVRGVWPERKPLFVRVSATDWVEGGLTIEETVAVARMLKGRGVDVVDCSSGGSSPLQKIAAGPGFQVPFAERVRREAGIATMAVGMITEPAQAEAIVREEKADLVALARQELRDPYWPQNAARALGVKPAVPPQYGRAH